MKALRFAALLSALLASAPLVTSACNLGAFPNFLEPLDPLDPVEGDVRGWILAQEDQSQVLVLSESGKYLHSVINRDTSVVMEVGAFLIERGSIVMRREIRYNFPTETGGVNSRTGAQSESVDGETERAAVVEDDRLTIDGWGTFISTDEYVQQLDLETREGRGCLLKYIQLSVRTAQSRILKLGSGGTAIYLDNKSTFVGFLSGEQSIVVKNALSPDTTIAYDDFRDFPEVRLGGAVVSHVNTKGDGTLDHAVTFSILGRGAEDGAGGAGGADAAGTSSAPLLATGRLIYGPADPIEIRQADVVGGSYDFELATPVSEADNFSWTFLADLDLRGCYSLGD